jgi:hypothetical protein
MLHHFSPSRTVKSDLARHKSVDSNIFLPTFHLCLHFKTSKLSMVLAVFSRTDSVSTGNNVSPSNKSMNSESSCKILSKRETLSNPEALKIFQITTGMSKPDALSGYYKPLFCKICTTFQSATTIGVNVCYRA